MRRGAWAWFHGVWTCGAKVLESYILKQQCLSVWAVSERFFQSLAVPCGDKQDKAARAATGGARRGAISIKEILGENRGTCI